MTKPHLIGKKILDQQRAEEELTNCSCAYTTCEVNGREIEVIEWIAPGCPVHHSDWERLHPQESNLPHPG